MKRFFSLFLALLLLLGGCKPLPRQQSNYRRVAVLFSSFAEVWQLAGGEVAITVGESVERGICKEGVLLVDQGAGKTIDTELLLSYRPDLVIGSADIPAHQTTAETLEQAGIPCMLFRVETFEDYLAFLKYATAITGNREAYQKYGIDQQKEIDAILQQVKSIPQRPTVLFIRSGSSAASAKAKQAEQHFAAGMLQQLGAVNIADQAPLLLDGLSLEIILRQNPDRIFISPMGNEEAAKAYMDSLLSTPAWSALSAVKNKQYAYLPKELFQYKPNHRWAKAYRTLAEILYPEHFHEQP